MLKHLRLVARRRHSVEIHAVDRNGASWRRYVSIFAFATAILANPTASQCQGMPGGQPAGGDPVEPGDGRSNARTTIVVDGNCTLVDAITAANTDAPAGSCGAGNGADTIELTGDVTLTERDNVDRGNNGLPVISTEVLLDGRGHTIRRSSGAIPFRLFRIAVDPSLPDDEPAPSLTLLNTTVTGGRLEDSSHGGAISNGAGSYLTLIDSTVSDSYVDNGAGGGIYNRGTMDLIGTTVTANIARGFRAGGIENTGKATLTSSTISANMGSYGGSGGGVNSLGVLTLINSTVSGNSGAYYGGGVSTYPGSSTTVLHSTIADNDSAGYFGTSDNIRASGEFNVRGSIIVAGGCDIDTFVDGGENFASSANCPGESIDFGVDIDTELADNGGRTHTHALLDGSVAIDTTENCAVEADQRGARREDELCDSGSFEADVDCDLILNIENQIVERGDELRFLVELTHWRDATVSVPIVLSVFDPAGDLVAKRVTAPRAFVLGNNLSATLTQKIPETTPLEVFTLVAEIDEMQQGTARAEAEFLVVAPEP